MAENNLQNRAELLIKHVFGNVMRVAVPLTQIVRTLDDGREVETETDFYPNTAYPIEVVLTREGNFNVKYTPTLVDNVVTFEDDGTLPTGTYNVTILCHDQQNQPCRYMVRSKIKVVAATKDAGIVAGVEFDAVDYVLDGAVYFYAKGDKGDPFTYEDFTTEQIADLKRPAVEAAEHVLVVEGHIEEAERQRVLAEQERVLAEQGRVEAENQRVLNEESRERAESERQESYQQAESQRNADYQSAESSRDTLYSTAEGSRNAQYQQAENQRTQAFGIAEAARDRDVQNAVDNARADYVGNDNYVYHWNPNTHQYEKTDIYVKGEQGVSVQSVEQIVTSTESGGVNVVRITLTNGNTYDFEVRNGQKVEPVVVGTTLYL